MKFIQIKTSKHTEMVDITDYVQRSVDENARALLIYVPHTTCGLTINEGADPDVKTDVVEQFERLVPWEQDFFKHMEGNSAAHIKSILIGNSVQVIVENGRIQLGTWEKIFLCEFDGPRTRKIWIQLL